MFGKVLLASEEALEGYDSELRECLCKTPEDYIHKIIHFINNRPKRFNEKYRSIYINNYSTISAKRRINSALQGLPNGNK